MKITTTLPAALLLATSASAFPQVQPGDLITRANAQSNSVAIHRPDGTLVAGSFGPLTDQRTGVALLPGGGWVTFRLDPAFTGWFMMTYDAQGNLVSEVLTDRPGSISQYGVASSSDGLVLVAEASNLSWKVHRYGSDSRYLGVLDLGPFSGASGDAMCPTDDGGFWVFNSGFFNPATASGLRFDRDLNLVGSVDFPDDVDDVALAPDGSFWTTKYGSSTVSHYSSTGLLVESFDFDLGVTPAGQLRSPSGVTVADDGTLWVCSNLSVQITHLSPNGDILGSFDSANPLGVTEVRIVRAPKPMGESYCPGVPNSTLASAVLEAYGSHFIGENRLELRVKNLPVSAFGYFLVSQQQSLVVNAGGSSGNLCLGGAVGRFIGPGQIQNSGPDGAFSLAIDLDAIPTPLGPVGTMEGETLNFQTWHRDTSPAGLTSNFSNGVSIVFR